MINRFKNYPFLLCLLSATAALISYVIITKYAQPYMFAQTQTAQLSPEHFIDHVDTLLTNSWNTITTNAEVTAHDCELYIEKNRQALKKGSDAYTQRMLDANAPTLSEQTIKVIQEVLLDFGFNPEIVPIVPYNEASTAATDDFKLYINEERFQNYSDEAQRFLIAHELTHLKLKDQSTFAALHTLLQTKVTKDHAQAINNMLDTYSHAIEFRADINAMLKSEAYTKGGIEFFNDLIVRYGDHTHSSHPSAQDRLKIAQDIHTLHQQGVQYA